MYGMLFPWVPLYPSHGSHFLFHTCMHHLRLIIMISMYVPYLLQIYEFKLERLVLYNGLNLSHIYICIFFLLDASYTIYLYLHPSIFCFNDRFMPITYSPFLIPHKLFMFSSVVAIAISIHYCDTCSRYLVECVAIKKPIYAVVKEFPTSHSFPSLETWECAYFSFPWTAKNNANIHIQDKPRVEWCNSKS